MREQTKKHIELALDSDPEITPQAKKMALAILKGQTPRRRLGTTRQACEILDGCHPITLRRAEKRGHVHAIRYSARKIRWDLDEVEAYANNGVEAVKGDSCA